MAVRGVVIGKETVEIILSLVEISAMELRLPQAGRLGFASSPGDL